MIYFDVVDFSECHSEDVFWHSVYKSEILCDICVTVTVFYMVKVAQRTQKIIDVLWSAIMYWYTRVGWKVHRLT